VDRPVNSLMKLLSDIYQRLMDCHEMLTFLKLHASGSQHDHFVILRKDLERIEKKVDAFSGPYYGPMEEEDKHDT